MSKHAPSPTEVFEASVRLNNQISDNFVSKGDDLVTMMLGDPGMVFLCCMMHSHTRDEIYHLLRDKPFLRALEREPKDYEGSLQRARKR